MAHFQVQAPDGHTYEFEAPDDATPEQLDAMTREVAGYGKTYPVDAPKPAAPEPGIGEQLLDNTVNDVAGIAQGAAALPDMAAEGVGKVLSAIPNAISHALSAAGHDDAATWIQDNITHNLANPVQIGDAVESIAPTPDTAAGKVNRFIGNLVGGAVTVPASATEAVVAKLVGDAPKIPVVAKATAKTLNQDFAAAADRQGIDYMAADLPKAMKSKFATALSNLTLGGIPIAEQAEKNIGTVANAAERIAGDIGSVADKTGAGQAAQRGARQFVDRSAAALDTLESKIPIPAGAPAVVGSTREALTGLAQSFSSNPKLAAAFRDPKIAAYLDALTPQTTQEATGVLDAAGNPVTREVQHGGGLSWNDLRDFRTRVGQIIGQPGLTSDGAQIGQLRALYGALSDDIRQTASRYGPQAEKSWTRWNNYARARANRIENVVSLIVGKSDDKGPQSAFEAMQRLASEKGGDSVKLAQALRSMPQDEADSVRATMLGELGKASAGQQNAVGDVFSPAQFVTSWNKLGDRAKNILFTGEHRAAIDDVVKVVSGMKASTKFANSSKTGIGVVASTHTIPMMLANPIVGAIDMALQYGSGKLLASPSVARKIAGTPLNAKGATAYWSRPWVKAMALKNPVIAGELLEFQKSILAHANDDVVGAAAASPDADSEQQQ
jgi:hypothetical protein